MKVRVLLVAMLLLVYCYKQPTVLAANTTLFIHENLYETKVTMFFAKLLLKYKDFLIIFHAERSTIRLVDSVIGYFNYKARQQAQSQVTNIMIYNHDVRSHQEFTRRNASKIVNLLFFNNSLFWQSLSRHDKLNYNDVVILVGSYRNLHGKVLKAGVEFVKIAGKVVLIEFAANRSINLYDICYYCGVDSMRFQLIENTGTSSLRASTNQLMPQKLKNLRGHVLKAVFISYFPYTFCKSGNSDANNAANESSVCSRPAGTELDMLQTLSAKLNFSYQVWQMGGRASFMDMIEYIGARRADIAFGGISMTVDRIPVVQFTKQYNTEAFTFLYLIRLTLDEVFDKFIEPFNAIAVWSLYAVLFLLLSLLLFVALNIETSKQRYNAVSLCESIWILYRAIFEQSHPHIHTVYRARPSTAMTLAFWWYVCIILNTTYKSTMLSTVVNPASMEPDDLPSLIRAGYNLVANKQLSDMIKELLLVPDDPQYRHTLSRISYGPDTCDVFEQILDGQVAMLDETATFQYELHTVCPKPDIKVMRWLRVGRHAIRSTGHAWAMQQGAPFKQAMDYYINLILSGGHFKWWKQNITSVLRAQQIPSTRQVKPKSFRRLSVTRFFPVLVIYLMGVCLAILCFIMEMITYAVVC